MADFSTHAVTIVDGWLNSVVDTIAVGDGPTGVAVNPATGRVYVANAQTKPGTVSVIQDPTPNLSHHVMLPIVFKS